MAIIGLQKGSGKRSRVREKVSEKSGNFDMDNEWQPCWWVGSIYVLWYVAVCDPLHDVETIHGLC